MKKIINLILLFAVSVQLASCQNKETKAMNIKYKWEEGKSCPLGYPIEVYRGGFSTKEGDFVSLYSGITTGKRGWGSGSNGMSSGEKPLPDHLYVQWLSYAEDAMFEVETDIDKEKIVAYFREGYKRRGASGEIRSENFDQIVAGFAPGGVVVIWVTGAGIQKEIGRYQGKKIEITRSETDALESPDKNLFSKEYRQKILSRNNVVPLEVQQANKDKPIPYGLWDTYRTQYHWRPVFQIQNEGTMGDFGFLYLNGERSKYFYESNLRSESDNELFYQAQDDTVMMPVPRSIGFDWKDSKGKEYAGYFKFNEQEILKAFAEIGGEDKDTKIEMLIRLNIPNSYASVTLRGSNGKELGIYQHDDDNFFEVKE